MLLGVAAWLGPQLALPTATFLCLVSQILGFLELPVKQTDLNSINSTPDTLFIKDPESFILY